MILANAVNAQAGHMSVAVGVTIFQATAITRTLTARVGEQVLNMVSHTR